MTLAAYCIVQPVRGDTIRVNDVLNFCEKRGASRTNNVMTRKCWREVQELREKRRKFH